MKSNADVDFTELCKIFMQIDETLIKIEERITNLEDRLRLIENTLTNIQERSQKMDTHINFVENIYDVFKSPFRCFLSWYYRNDSNNQDKIKKLDYPNTKDKIN